MYSSTIIFFGFIAFYAIWRLHSWKSKDVKPYKGRHNGHKKTDENLATYESLNSSLFTMADNT